MKYIYYILFACACVMMACSGSDGEDTGGVPAPSSSDVISFATGVSSETTRATTGSIDDLDALKATPEGFGVFAYVTDDKDWATAVSADADLSGFSDYLMYNQQVTWGVQYVDDSSDPHYDWVYAPLKYWPNSSNNATNRYVSFFAYAPYVAAGAASGITGFTNSSDKLPHIIYEIAGGNEQVDLLYANCMDATRNGQGLITADSDPLAYQRVLLQFHHALAAVDIYVQRVYDEPVYTGKTPSEDVPKLYISKLELVSATDGADGLQTGGRLNLETGEWTQVGTAWNDATGKQLTYTESMIDDYLKGTTSDDPLVIRDTELGKFGEASGVDEQERTLIKGAMAQVFLPRKVTLIPTITFSMVKHDENLAIGYYTDLTGKKYSRIVNTVTGNSATIDFQAGKRYKLLIRIGVEHVSFEVVNIVDWDFPMRYQPSVIEPFGSETIGHRVDEQ